MRLVCDWYYDVLVSEAYAMARLNIQKKLGEAVATVSSQTS
jgi:hypothetical protein